MKEVASKEPPHVTQRRDASQYHATISASDSGTSVDGYRRSVYTSFENNPTGRPLVQCSEGSPQRRSVEIPRKDSKWSFRCRDSYIPSSTGWIITSRSTTSTQRGLDIMSSDQPRILIVDDSKLIRRLAATLLTPAGYNISEAAGPQEALQMLGQESFDLVIMDIMMPGMTGLDVARKIRSSEKLQDLPILFCTSLSDRDTVLDAANLAPMDYVTKPLNRQILLEKTKPLIERSRQQTNQTEEAT